MKIATLFFGRSKRHIRFATTKIKPLLYLFILLFLGTWNVSAQTSGSDLEITTSDSKSVLLSEGVSLADQLAFTASGVEPIWYPSNPSCASIGKGNYAIKLEDNFEDLVEPGVIYTRTFTLTSGQSNVELISGPEDPNSNITVTISDDGLYLDWALNSNCVKIIGVIVKGGDDANYYEYGGNYTEDQGLYSPIKPNSTDPYAVSHVEFCYEGTFDIVCPADVTVDCEGSTNPSLTGEPTVNPECSAYTCGTVDFTYSDVNEVVGGCGTITRTWTATDGCGNTATCTQTITITDDIAPTWTTGEFALDRTLSCEDATGLTDALALFPVASDNCDTDVTDIVKTPGDFVAGDCGNAGTYTNTWVVTDDCGNKSAVYTQTITITDDIAPTITCPDDIVVECGDDIPSISDLIVTASDNCDSDVEITWVRSDGVIDDMVEFPRGITTVTFTATDDCGNSTSCDMTVTVIPCYYCTYTQGFYGNEGGLTCDGNNSLYLMENAFITWGDDEVVFGNIANNFTLHDYDITSGDIFTMLPGGGASAALDGEATYTDEGSWRNVPIRRGVIANNLLAQAITLWFNMQNDPALGMLTIEGRFIITAESVECGSDFGIPGTESYTEIPQSVVDYFNYHGIDFTVDELLKLANRVLGGEIDKKELSAGDVTAAMDAINVGFDECRILVGFSDVKPEDTTQDNTTLVIDGGEIQTREETEEVVISSVDGILEFNIELKVYPNPFAHDVFFEMTPRLNTNFKLEIYSMTGQLLEVLYDDQVIAHMQYIFKFNGDNYGYSSFMVKVTTDHGVGAGRILKIR